MLPFCGFEQNSPYSRACGDNLHLNVHNKTFYLQMLLLISLFCMAFASTFYLLLAEQARFQNFPIAVLSTFVSMLGEFDYDNSFVNVGYYGNFYGYKLTVFVVFVLLMVLVVNNVLIGLAVGDTEYVMNMAKIQRLRDHVSGAMLCVG